MAESPGDLKQALEFRPQEVEAMVRSLKAKRPAAELVDIIAPYLRSVSARTRTAAVAGLAALEATPSWNALQAALQDPVPNVRSDALKALAAADDADSVARLAAAARHKDAEIRRDAIIALWARTGPDRDAALRDLFKSDDPWTRRAALEAIAVARPSAYQELLGAALRDPHAGVRGSASRLAAMCDDGPAFELLLAGLDDTDRDARRISRQRLDKVKLAPLEAVEILGRMTPVRGREADAFIAALLEKTATADLASRLGAYGPIADNLLLQTIAGRGDEGARVLEPILRGRDSARAVAAIQALLAIATADQLAGLLAAWDRLHVEVRRLLVERGLEGALSKGAADPDASVRRVAVQALIKAERFDLLPPDLFLEQFLAALDDPGWTDAQREKLARQAARQGMSAVPALERGAASKSAGLRRACVTALGSLDARDALWNFRDTDDPAVLKTVALTLGSAADPRGLDPLIRAVEEGRGDLPSKARKLLVKYEKEITLERCCDWMAHKRPSFRRFSAERLGASGDERAVPPLLQGSTDADYEVQQVAVKALKAFVAREDVVDRLLGCVTTGELAVRQAAVEVLGEGRVERAVPDLIRALGNPLLRPRAETALRQIGDRQGHLAVLRRKRRDENIGAQRDKIAQRNAKGGRNLAGPTKKKKMF